jgi:hypothetical protein
MWAETDYSKLQQPGTWCDSSEAVNDKINRNKEQLDSILGQMNKDRSEAWKSIDAKLKEIKETEHKEPVPAPKR